MLKKLNLILRKIIEIVAITPTRYQILKLKSTKIGFDCGCAPDPGKGDYSALLDLFAGIKGTNV